MVQDKSEKSESVLKIFSARQVLEIILNEYSRNTGNAFFELLGKETTRYLRNLTCWKKS
jgi:hypothetical protein